MASLNLLARTTCASGYRTLRLWGLITSLGLLSACGGGGGGGGSNGASSANSVGHSSSSLSSESSSEVQSSAIGGGVSSSAGSATSSSAVSSSSSSIPIADTTPDAFSFTAQFDVTQGALAESEAITLSGIDAPTPISITGGEYALDNGDFTNLAGSVKTGQQIRVRLQASALSLTKTSAQLTVGDVVVSFDVTTEDNQAPVATIIFPLTGSHTTGTLLSVRGSASDPEGDAITSITVNGIEATSDDDFASWQVANLTVQAGTNLLNGTVTDIHGNQRQFSGRFEQRENAGILMKSPLAFAYASDGDDQLLVVDSGLDALLSLDVSEGSLRGKRTIMSQQDDGKGVNMRTPRDLSLDLPRNRALVLDTNSINTHSVIAIDLATGVRSTLVTGLKSANALIANPSSGYFLVSDNKIPVNQANGVDGIFKFDLIDPASSNYDPNDRPNSPNAVLKDLPSAYSMVLDPNDSNRVLTVSRRVGVDALFSVDVSAKTKTQLHTFANPDVVAFFPGDSKRALVSSGSALLAIDLDTDALSLVSGIDGAAPAETGSSEIIGKGPDFLEYSDLLFDRRDSNKVFLLPVENNIIYRLDLTTGDRTPVDEVLGGGPELLEPSRIALLPNTQAGALPQLIVLDDLINRHDIYYSINLADSAHPADRQLISGFDANHPNQPRGDDLGADEATDFVVDSQNNRLIAVDDGLRALIAIDLTSGDRSVISSSTQGTGPAFGYNPALALDAANNQVYVGQDRTLLKVDLSTGNRELVSNADTGMGDIFNYPTSLTLVPSHNLLLMTENDDSSTARVFTISLPAGNRTPLAEPGDGKGIELSDPMAVAYDEARNRLLVVDRDLVAVVAIDLSTLERSIVSASSAGPDEVMGTEDDTRVGNGSPFNAESKLASGAFDSEHGILYIVDKAAGSVIAVDVISGDRTLISGFAF